MQHESRPLRRRQRVEHDQQGKADGIRQPSFLFGVAFGRQRFGLVADRLLAARFPGAQHVEGDAGDDGGEPGVAVFDLPALGPHQPDPGLLHRILGLARRAEHAIGERLQPAAAPRELLAQRLSFVHRLIPHGVPDLMTVHAPSM